MFEEENIELKNIQQNFLPASAGKAGKHVTSGLVVVVVVVLTL